MSFNNQVSNWFAAQVVTAGEMNIFGEDMYYRFAQLTNTVGGASPGCILTLDSFEDAGGGDFNIGTGSFVFPNSDLGYMLYSPCIMAIAPAASLTGVTGDGFIVATYSVDPTSGPNYNYNFTAAYNFVDSVDTTTDCVIATITGGVVNLTGYGQFFNTPHINDNPLTDNVLIAGQVIFTGDEGSRPYLLNATPGVWDTNSLLMLSDFSDSTRQSIGETGYQMLPGGLIFQWGRVTYDSDPFPVDFPIGFPHACFVVMITPGPNSQANAVDQGSGVYAITCSDGVGIDGFSITGIGFDPNLFVSWFAIGN